MAPPRAPCSTPPMRRCTMPSASPEAGSTRRGRSTPPPLFKPGVEPLYILTRRTLRFFTLALFTALLALAGCQTAPPKGLSSAQIAVLKQQGFELTDEGWAFGLSGKVLFGSDLEVLNKESHDIVERIAKALLGVGSRRVRVNDHADAAGYQTDIEQHRNLGANSV